MARHQRELPFIIRGSAIQGRGAFAIHQIRKGTRVIEYLGERISHEEAEERYPDDEMERHHTFLFSVDEETVIDGGREGNEASLINHSCDPNCEAVDEDGRIFIEAMRTIYPGEELTYDYNFELEDEHDEEARALYPCACGADNCRGTILVEKEEEPEPARKEPRKTRRKR
ncbi:MAG: SET domain-containing protein-lysine N-methyltransferase [Gemmatimonadota bacterium]